MGVCGEKTLGLAERQFCSFLDLVSVNGATGNFQDVHRIVTVGTVLRTGVVSPRANRHIAFDMGDPFLSVQPNKIQCDFGIFHPERPGLRLTEEK